MLLKTRFVLITSTAASLGTVASVASSEKPQHTSGPTELQIHDRIPHRTDAHPRTERVLGDLTEFRPRENESHVKKLGIRTQLRSGGNIPGAQDLLAARKGLRTSVPVRAPGRAAMVPEGGQQNQSKSNTPRRADTGKRLLLQEGESGTKRTRLTLSVCGRPRTRRT